MTGVEAGAGAWRLRPEWLDLAKKSSLGKGMVVVLVEF